MKFSNYLLTLDVRCLVFGRMSVYRTGHIKAFNCQGRATIWTKDALLPDPETQCK